MNTEQIIQELQFKAVRSSGAGGQHVNKVATKVELYFNIQDSKGLTEAEKQRVKVNLSNKINKEVILSLQCDKSRSQFRNKELVIKRFLEVLKEALKVSKIRRKTKPSRSVLEKRLKSKQQNSLKKKLRNKPGLD
ncbi:alternative ribosome rescue aminoacyl-tRNA hydrolase ArfB [Wenyingzhuangia sp. IMCC45533]